MHTPFLVRTCKPVAACWIAVFVIGSGCQQIRSQLAAVMPDRSQTQAVERPAVDRHTPGATPAPPADGATAPAPVQAATAVDPDLMLFGAEPARQIDPGQPRPVVSLQQQTFTDVGRDFDPDVDSAGKQIVFASTRHGERPNLYLQSTKGKAVTQLTSDPASSIQPRFSPDGKKIAFASDRAGQWDIYVLDLETHATSQVTHNLATELAPSWSPDGKWLAYTRLSPAGIWELWLVSMTGDGERCIGPGLLPRWSPDGAQLVFQRPRQRDGMLFGIWTVRMAGGEPSWPTEIAAEPDAALICPVWSPDGKQIAFCRVPVSGLANGAGGATFRPGRADIYVVDADGGNRIRLTDGGASFGPCWSAEGRLFFSTDRDGRERIWSLRVIGPAKPSLAAAAQMNE